MKIAHVADTHIKNLKYHDEYREIFNKMYEIMREQKVDAIVHCGDIAHTKTQISPEFVDMTGEFFKNLASIAPTYIILGNHDGNLRNDSRQDAITPIVSALNLPNLFLLKDSGEMAISDDVTLNVMSVFDQENWVKPVNPDKINIALLHGSVSGVQTDTNYVMEHGEFTVDIFEGHDYAFLGDIHKTNQILDLEGRVRYPGSTVQQNFGETDDKGFLIWDIQSKESFSCKHYAIPNPRPFVTLVLDENGVLPEIDVKKGARVRIVADKNVTLEKVKKATEVVKSRFQPESVTFVNKAVISKASQDEINSIGHADNLRDLGVQERLIRDYLKDFKAEEEVVNKVVDLNKKLSSAIEEGEEINRNVRWSLKELEWDNLFNYGEGNHVNFGELSGIVGIFGKNYSGKSSIVDSMLYTLFNTTAKNNRKNLNVINQNREKGRGKVKIEIDDGEYVVERKSEKYVKKLKGVETIEAKTDVEFTSSNESLNGLARNDTDKNIRRFLGTVDDFFLTSMASQFGYLSFISEGSTKRKEILAKFLDLENFDKKFKLAKDESAELKGLLKKLEGVDYKRDIANAETQLSVLDSTLAEQKSLVEELRGKVMDANETLCQLQKSIANVPNLVLNWDDINNQLNSYRADRKRIGEENISLESEIAKLETLSLKIDEFLSNLDEKELMLKDQQLKFINDQVRILERDYGLATNEIAASDKKIKLLDQVPCGDKFPTCKFIKDAFAAKESYDDLVKNQLLMDGTLRETKEKFNALDAEVSDGLKKLSDIKKKRLETTTKLSSCQLKLEKNKNTVINLDKKIEEAEEKLKLYNDNREAIENYEKLLADREDAKRNVAFYTKKLTDVEHEIVELYKNHGSVSAKIDIFRKQEAELQDLRKQYSAYDLFLTCMHPSGISYEIIKSKLPEINQEIAKILANVVEFSIYLENDDDKLDIMIKHPKYDARPLEMGSGAEKTLASTAIRLALLNVTTLPKGDIFIMDEPGTALDAENLDGFVRILELIKGYFKTVILISHLDSLKDCVDMQIVIDRKDGFAYVNQ
jgi:DNA repair exonuclease SbcCD ATPase subunit/DNA repair exonuclease SbcCD nuclease subunit